MTDRIPSRTAMLRCSAAVTTVGFGVLAVALAAVSTIDPHTSPGRILQYAAGFIVLAATVSCSTAVFCVCLAFDSVAVTMAVVAANQAIGHPAPATRPALRVVEAPQANPGT